MPGAFITPQQLESARHALGGDLCKALEPLTAKLEYIPPKARRNGSARAYAEFREAKSLLSYLKYPDPTLSVRRDEMAWALGLVRGAYCADGEALCVQWLDAVSLVLGIAIEQPYAIPADLDRKIRNELRLTEDAKAAAPLAAVV